MGDEHGGQISQWEVLLGELGCGRVESKGERYRRDTIVDVKRTGVAFPASVDSSAVNCTSSGRLEDCAILCLD